MTTSSTKTIQLKRVPAVLWHRAKVIAATRGITLQRFVLDAVNAAVERHDRAHPQAEEPNRP